MTPAYDRIAIALHWAVVLLILVQYTTGWTWGNFERGSEPRFYLFRTHIYSGYVVLGLAVIRLAWRLGHPAPPLPAGMGRAAVLAAGATHGLLYLAIFVMPVLGILASTAFGKSLGRWPGGVHVALSYVVFGLVALHAAAAFWHQFVRRDGLLLRMWPARPR
ncbi:cytochrome b [Zavarzinia compransoris]|uniref:Cytochrome B n=1 Tax=Zavarzinia compransoris TaxID=1264899 RepID=A0A317DT35_9PROT|nr:cytochrome b [Zavarzinia compransoris]PWR17829.1 cytochrome B [Zavarzinia compransoris]TDP49363.1 cytochrome b561 [Zavarzinia compransoris]